MALTWVFHAERSRLLVCRRQKICCAQRIYTLRAGPMRGTASGDVRLVKGCAGGRGSCDRTLGCLEVDRDGDGRVV